MINKYKIKNNFFGVGKLALLWIEDKNHLTSIKITMVKRLWKDTSSEITMVPNEVGILVFIARVFRGKGMLNSQSVIFILFHFERVILKNLEHLSVSMTFAWDSPWQRISLEKSVHLSIKWESTGTKTSVY